MGTDQSPDILHPSDADLLSAAGRGDNIALGTLVDRYIDLVHRAAIRQTKNTHLAEDVTQAVFLVLRKRAASVTSSTLSAWLHQTTRHAAANACRSERRRYRREHAAARPEVYMRGEGDESNTLELMLDEALASLGAKDRAAIIDRYMQGRDLASVAISLGSSPGAAQKRIERSLNKLRNYFASRQRVMRSSSAVSASLLVATMGSDVALTPPSIAVTIKAALIHPEAASAASLSIAKGVLFMRQLKITTASFAAVLIGGGLTLTVMNVVTSVSAAPTTTSANAYEAPATQPFKLRNDAPRLSPFTAVRWNNDAAEVQYKDVWYQLISINDVTAADVMEYLTQSDDVTAQKHFAEDLVEVMRDMGHLSGKTVKLTMKTLDTNKDVIISDAAMTEENRQSVVKNARSSQ